jgi:hypothetical protein
VRFTVETWDTGYGSPLDGGGLEETTEPVDVSVEVGAPRWAPLDPEPSRVPPERILFLDGVRRIDARVWITEDELVHAGVCATVAAGVVECAAGRARTVACRVRRGLFTPAASAAPIACPHGTWEVFPVKAGTAEALYLGVHTRMIALEVEVSSELDGDLVIVDGPLRDRPAKGEMAGLVKTHNVAYLPEKLQGVVARLEAGQRSPVFLVGGRFTRWSWYIRLPGPRAHPMSGVVRCELPGRGTVADSVDRANAVTVALPRFASEPHKDTRAPQNLYPIAGLERDLRRRLGDPLLLERALRRIAAQAVYAT